MITRSQAKSLQTAQNGQEIKLEERVIKKLEPVKRKREVKTVPKRALKWRKLNMLTDPPVFIDANSKTPIRTAFTCFWPLLKDYIPFKQTMLNANAVILFAEDATIDFEYSQKDIRDQVVLQLKLDQDFDSKTLNIYNELLSRSQSFPDHPEHSKDSLISTIKQNYAQGKVESNNERKTKLLALLQANQCVFRADSRYCAQFINHTVCSSVEEVVAIMLLTRHLFSYSHAVWSNLNMAYRRQLSELVFSSNKPTNGRWISCCKQLVTSAAFISNCSSVKSSAHHRGRNYDYIPYDQEGRSRRRYFAQLNRRRR
jgi:hypothetical protein